MQNIPNTGRLSKADDLYAYLDCARQEATPERTAHALPVDLRWAREARNRMRVRQRLDTQMDAPAQKKSKLIKGATGDWEVVVGMEVHAQVSSQAKLFSGASTAFGGEPNSHVSLSTPPCPACCR